MNKQKSANDHNNCDTINGGSYVSISDNNISQNRIQSNNPHHQHRLLVLQNQSASSSQKGSLDKKADNLHQNYNENTVLSFQQYNQGISQKSPKKLIDSDYLNSQENPINSQDEIYYFSKNVNATKNVNQNRHKTPYQRIYVEQQSIQKQSIQNNQNSLGIQSSSQNIQNGNNNYRFSSQNKKEQTPKNKISIEEGNTQYKSNNRSAIRDLSNEGYYKNSDDQKINKIYGDSNGKQNNIAVREQLNNILQQQNSSIIKKLNGNRHNSQVNAYPNQETVNQNQIFNIRQIKKKSSISMNESQLASGAQGGGSGNIVATNGQNSQVIIQNNIKDRDGSGGKITNQQNSMCKYDSIRNMHNNSQDNSQQNIQNNNNKNNSSIYQYQPENQIFQVNIYNNQERQERIQQVYLGNKLNLTKKQMSPQKDVHSIQYETIDVNNKRKAKSTQRQQSILRERKQNSNTINFVHLNQSGGSANSGFGSNNNLSLYSLNQNQQNNICINSNHNNLSYESCYSSQNANKFYFRSKNNQTGSGAQSNQIQNSIVGCLPSTCQQNSSQIAQTSNQIPPSRRQLPQIKDTYNTIDNSATNPSSSLYRAKNVIRINGSVADKTYTNRTLDAQPLSSTSKQDKTNKIVITTINNDKKCGTLNDKSNPIINTNTNKTFNRKNQLNDTQLYKQIQQLNNNDSLNENTQNKINSRSQSIRRGRFQNSHNQQNAITQNKVNSQKENFPSHYQQQQAILTNNLQLQSCKHRDEQSSVVRQKFTSKNEQSKMIIINQQENHQFNLQDIVDAPVPQKQENIKIQPTDEQRYKGYNTISIEDQKRCASQTENRPESQVQKEKQNFYKQSYAIEKIQHLKSIETGDLIPTTNKINFERNAANPIHSPILNRDSSPVPQVHTPTKKRIKNQNQLNQKIEFFPQPPPPPPVLSSQNQQQNQSKAKYGQIIQKYQRGNIVKPKIQNANTIYTNQSSQQNQQQQQDNQYSTINPNSVGFINKHASQVSTNIAFSSNHCEDIQELKFNKNYANDESKNIFLNDKTAIDQTEESMDNLVKSLQDEVYQEIKDQEKEPANQQMHLQSLENSFYNYFASNNQNNKSQSNYTSNQMNQQTNLDAVKLEMNKQYSNEPEKPTVNLQKNSYNKITEKNEDQASSKAEEVRKDDFIFSTLDAFNRERKGSKAAKIIIDFDMDDDNEIVLNNQQNDNEIVCSDTLKEKDKQQIVDNPKSEELDFKINLQNSHKNLIEEPIDSGRNSPQVSKVSTAIKPLYYKYNNSFHQIQQTPDDTDINDIENNQPTFEKFIKSKVSNMRNSFLKQSVRYDNNFFNQQKLFQQQQQQLLQQQQQQQQQNQLQQQQQQHQTEQQIQL
ncbi:hypothetical protein TTHERM_00312500 (macronuclear) [Tetrahymena thermophila SB210]|uniref:Uncharacterized protein n=1 Tax=Tetrahymena thermophila (strain SB210) TaxID=312017 RepID=Q22KN1_TETTS|nr:hypothetical protein TTHERM_00312500 [Tetrahymena thermophila SB210]EAR85768.2 hypothetical protein TTHERM_00312500 [Tetrahymena thermophila SB210]|eukprot:XP_001033431.2 hypothetical protein TTHERM_00312500 [Tetrahymena thermophila SB210]